MQISLTLLAILVAILTAYIWTRVRQDETSLAGKMLSKSGLSLFDQELISFKRSKQTKTDGMMVAVLLALIWVFFILGFHPSI